MRTSMALGHLMGTWWSARRRVRTVPMTAFAYLHVCNMTRSCVWHDSFMCVAWLIHVCHMTRARVWHDSFMSHNNQFSTILAHVVVHNFFYHMVDYAFVFACSVCEISKKNHQEGNAHLMIFFFSEYYAHGCEHLSTHSVYLMGWLGFLGSLEL